MVVKQSDGVYAPDGSKYATIADGAGTILPQTTSISSLTKTGAKAQAPDGSIYLTLTNGSGTLV